MQVYWAIENEQYDTLKRLVESGVDVNLPDQNFMCIEAQFFSHDLQGTKAYIMHDLGVHEALFTPLAWAASCGYDSMVEFLLEHGANIDKTSQNLCSCSDNRLLRCPEMLPNSLEFDSREVPYDDDDSMVSSGSDLQDLPRVPEWTPLHYALCQGHESTAKLLIERGADTNEVGRYSGVTALHIATRWELDGTIDYLLDNDRVNINAQNSRGVTALHMAQVAGRDDLIDKYLDKGANVNLEYSDRTGPWTIFVMACAAGDYERALKYLKIGADPHFVLEDRDDRDSWTVMRLIYCAADDDDKCQVAKAEERMALEREIIARGNGASGTT